MTQTNVRALLSRLTEQLLIYFSEVGQLSESKEFAERLALGTWEGLILLLRQSIAHSDEVLLEEVGLLSKVDDQWIFEPAASLTEVDAMKLLPVAEHQYLAQKVLFHLNQATELLASIPEDQELPATAITAEERLLRAIFNETETNLSGSVRLIADQLAGASDRLQVRREDRIQGKFGSLQQEYEGTILSAIEAYDNATGESDETAHTKVGERESKRRYRGIVEGREVGKKVYQEEKRKPERSGEAEKPIVSSES